MDEHEMPGDEPAAENIGAFDSLSPAENPREEPAHEDGPVEEPMEPAAVADEPEAGDEAAAQSAPQTAVSAVSQKPPEVNPPIETTTGTSEPEEPVGDLQWYVLKVQSNRERSIRDSLLKRIKREGLEKHFGEVIIPTEKVVEKTKGGKKRVIERKLYPGYIMIQMNLNDETWYLVRDTGGVGDFTGAQGKPTPMRDDEIKRMLGLEETKEAEPAKIKIDLTPGETVKIKEGSFESFEGAIDTIDEEHGKITVLVEIFGRSVPTELEYWQVEKV